MILRMCYYNSEKPYFCEYAVIPSAVIIENSPYINQKRFTQNTESNSYRNDIISQINELLRRFDDTLGK